MFYPLLSKLLDYPDAGLMESLAQLRASLRQGFEASEWIVLDRFMKELSEQDMTQVQASYVLTFDLTPEHSLHLTHHLFGDDKNRGPALIDLAEYYKACGLELPVKDMAVEDDAPNELPDYLPLMLEFCAQLDEEEARIFLSRWGKVLNQLAANLEEAASPYAPLIRLVEHRSQLVMATA